MQIDRRDCLAGVAATAAAAMLPALPARAIMSGGRFYFTDGPIFSALTPWSPAVDDAPLWQFDPNDRLWLIRHIVTGLMCRRAPQEYDGFALQAVSLDISAEAWRPLVIEPWPDEATLAAIGRATHCVAFATFLKRAGWPRTGARSFCVTRKQTPPPPGMCISRTRPRCRWVRRGR